MSYQQDEFAGIIGEVNEKLGKPRNTPMKPIDIRHNVRAIQTGGKPSSDTWERPLDRPEPPTIGENEQVIYELFGVGEYSPNDNAFRLSTSTGQYAVDWGDGEITYHNSNTIAQHIYNYATLDKPVGNEGYKWVWIKAYPVSGNLTVVDFHQYRHSLRPAASSSNIFIPQVFEVYMRGSEITDLSNSVSYLTQFRLCDIFYFYGTHKIAALNYFCYNYHNLKRMIADLSTVTAYFMYYCYSYNQPFPSGVTFSSATIGFMSYCYSYNQPFPSGVTFNSVTTYFMQYCYSYNQPFPSGVTFNSATISFMRDCNSYNQPFPSGVTFNSATAGFMYNCYSYNQPFPSGVTFNSVTTSFMYGCSSYNQPLIVYLQNTTAIGTQFISVMNFALKSLRLLNMGLIHTVLTISNSSLDVQALVDLFGDLADRTSTSTGTITITGVYGASRLTAEQRAIATNKNWTIVG